MCICVGACPHVLVRAFKSFATSCSHTNIFQCGPGPHTQRVQSQQEAQRNNKHRFVSKIMSDVPVGAHAIESVHICSLSAPGTCKCICFLSWSSYGEQQQREFQAVKQICFGAKKVHRELSVCQTVITSAIYVHAKAWWLFHRCAHSAWHTRPALSYRSIIQAGGSSRPANQTADSFEGNGKVVIHGSECICVCVLVNISAVWLRVVSEYVINRPAEYRFMKHRVQPPDQTHK